jgi:RNA-directed DNA polymerase
MTELMEKELGLTVNREKTRTAILPGKSFVFLGYEFTELYSWKLCKHYLGARPAGVRLERLREEIHNLTAANMGLQEASYIVKKINEKLRGWANHFKHGASTKAFKSIRNYVISRFRHWMGRKHKWKIKKYKEYNDQQLYKMSGLVNMMDLLPKYS